SLAMKYRVILPSDLILVFKSIMTLEAMARDLDPGFDLVGSGARYAKTVLRSLYKPEYLAKELIFTARDWLEFSRKLPRQLGEITRQVECGEAVLNLNIKGIE